MLLHAIQARKVSEGNCEYGKVITLLEKQMDEAMLNGKTSIQFWHNGLYNEKTKEKVILELQKLDYEVYYSTNRLDIYWSTEEEKS